jgi:hypothetical protein
MLETQQLKEVTRKATPESSNVVAHGYHPETQTMVIEFKGGSLYHAPGVSQEEYDALDNAESVGRHFHRHLKSKYPFQRVE